MKKFIYTMLAFMFVLPIAFGLVACGNKEEELKPADFVGTWYTETQVDKRDGETTGTETYARFMELHNKASRTPEEDDEYANLETYIFMFNVKSDGTLQYKQYFADEADYSDAGTWAIKDNKLTAEITMFPEDGTVSVEYTNGKIVIKYSRDYLGHLYEQHITLAKLAA